MRSLYFKACLDDNYEVNLELTICQQLRNYDQEPRIAMSRVHDDPRFRPRWITRTRAAHCLHQRLHQPKHQRLAIAVMVFYLPLCSTTPSRNPERQVQEPNHSASPRSKEFCLVIFKLANRILLRTYQTWRLESWLGAARGLPWTLKRHRPPERALDYTSESPAM